MRYDLVVAGAGPAGSAVARDTAKAGLKVLLLEEHREIGRPLQCSGFVAPRTLDEVGEGAEVLVRNRVKGAIIRGPAGGRLLLGGDRVRAVALDRVQLDRLLAQSAQRAGAELRLGSRLERIEPQDGHLELTLFEGPGGRRTQVQTWLLVGADGWNSTVARWMGVPRGFVISAVSIDVELSQHPLDLVQVFVGDGIAPGWFGWTIPLGDGTVRIGVGCDPAQTTVRPRRLLEGLLEAFPEEFHGVQPRGYVGGFIPLYQQRQPPMSTSMDHVLLVGDAASQVKPTSGGGIYAGLRAARHAARASIMAMERGDFSARTLSVYERGWRGELQEELERGADVREHFLRLSDQQLERLLRLLGMTVLRRVILRDGDIDFQSPLYAQLLRVAPILRRILSVPSLLPMRWGRLLGGDSSER